MPFIETVDSARIFYEDQGGGPPLVFIHGWSMSGRAWRFQAEPFAAAGYRVIVPDLRGHGQSTAPGGQVTLQGCGDDLATLFSELGLSGVVLIGWSLGALVSLAAFPRLRSSLEGMALVGGTPRFTATEGYPHGVAPTEPKGMGIRLRRDFQKTMGEFFRGMFASGELSRQQENRIAREIVMRGRQPDPDVALSTLAILASADLRAGLGAIDLPVMLLHGSLDTVCPVAAARYMAEQIPGAGLELMDGCGHAPFMSHPEEFNRRLGGFLERVHGRH
ncbi:MAG: alpha/beta fold hydrolase [Geobacter sp.]|nr:alpha/beta fold hydrolase [Geobacter sp.]